LEIQSTLVFLLSWLSLLFQQATPGPLFNFSAYLGAIIAWNRGYNPMIGILLCWFGIFTPGILLIFAFLPYWTKFRKWEPYRRAIPGEYFSIHTMCIQG
jgi:chromate transporter